MPNEKKRGNYHLNQSPLFKLRSKRRLAKLFKMDLKELYVLLKQENNYRVFPQGKRICHDPKPQMKAIHKRLQILLNRIAAPEYLHPATKGRSYITNASAHLGNNILYKLDMRDFYNSTTRMHIYDFFRNTMFCSKDVAALLAKLTTYENKVPYYKEPHLPTGSPVSPILSYFAHKSVFDKMHVKAIGEDSTLTIYVDDITLSGNTTLKEVFSYIKEMIVKRGLEFHKEKKFQKGHVKIVTGVAYRDQKMLLPNKRHKKIYDDKILSINTVDLKERQKTVQRLASRIGEASRIEPEHFEKDKQSLRQININLSQELRKKASN